MEQTKEKCPHCGARMKIWTHSLTPGLVNILFKAIRFVKANGINEFHVHQDIGLTHFEAANFQKLRFHGLVAHADPENKRNGRWLLTLRAGQFLRGEIAVPKAVQTFRNRVTCHSQETLTINDFRGKLSWFEQEFNFVIAEGKIKSNVTPQNSGVHTSAVGSASNSGQPPINKTPGLW